MVAASTGASDLVAVSHSSGVMFDFSLTGERGQGMVMMPSSHGCQACEMDRTHAPGSAGQWRHG